jgi:hypothetical protein
MIHDILIALISIHLKPLLDKLQILWHEQIYVHDHVNKHNGLANSIVKAILMWCIHDFSNYGKLCLKGCRHAFMVGQILHLIVQNPLCVKFYIESITICVRMLCCLMQFMNLENPHQGSMRMMRFCGI